MADVRDTLGQNEKHLIFESELMVKKHRVTLGALLGLVPALAWAGQDGRPGGPPQMPEFMTASPILRAIDVPSRYEPS